MTIVMNMSTYIIEREARPESISAEDAMREYSNLALNLAIQQHDATLENSRTALPASLANVDVEKFLRKMCLNPR